MKYLLDINEESWSQKVFEILLLDRTTNRNIIWATEDYEYLGDEYQSHFEIKRHLITGKNSNIIKPRVAKNKDKQGDRTKEKAEVFTPSWLCNEQNNLIDHTWFGRENVFNIPMKKTWKSINGKIEFPKLKDKTWEKYVDERRMEIACGEAPYLVSRYDTVTGEMIDIKERIGLLDRKMRVVAENAEDEKDWLKWSRRVFESIYGFEFQGDSLLLARENLLMSYIEYMNEKIQRDPTVKELIEIANIISWNIWQMDGLTYTIPFRIQKDKSKQRSIFDFIGEDIDDSENEDVLCMIKDWRSRKIVSFSELVSKGEQNG